MKKIGFLLIAVILSTSFASAFCLFGKKKAPVQAKPQPQPKLVLKSKIDSLSYAIGVNIGSSIKKQLAELPDTLNSDLLLKAFVGVYKADTSVVMKNEVATALIQKYFTAEQEKQSTKDKEAGVAFLETNKKKPGVITTASGLQYEIISAGKGEKPTATDKVKVNYRGTLLNGKEFDSSYSRKEPAVFGVNQVIPGWTEALQLMTVGSKWKIYIPYNIAYGERGAGKDIKPYSTLIFEVELIDIVKQ